MKKTALLIWLMLISLSAFSVTLNPIQLLNPTGSTSGQVIVSSGASSAPAWGTVPIGDLSPVASDSVLTNATGSIAAATAFSMPSCSASGNALKWTTNTGFGCVTALGITANPLSQFSSTTSSQLSGIISDETGTGSLVFATSPVLVTPNIGTPSAGVATNITGTASGLTAGHVTTNANLTGPITSSGNATSVASQTGTGSTFVMSTSPTISGTLSTAAITATGAITKSTTNGIIGTTLADNANAGSEGEYITATAGPISLTTATATNITSISLTAGDWDVSGIVLFSTGASTVTTATFSGINTVSATFSVAPPYNNSQNATSIPSASNQTLIAPTIRINVSTTTTVYLISQANFSVSTVSGYGTISARRRR